MSRAITTKQIQVHQECSCGTNTVENEKVRIRFVDMKAVGIKYRKDKSTGKWFCVRHQKIECTGHDIF